MEIEEVLAKTNGMVGLLRSIKNSYPNDAKLQGLVSELTLSLIEQSAELNRLYHYRDAAEGHCSNGSARHDT